MSNVIEEAGWKFHWRLTESAGIMVYLADYKGRRVLWEGSLPYITVDHQRETLDPKDDPGKPRLKKPGSGRVDSDGNEKPKTDDEEERPTLKRRPTN